MIKMTRDGEVEWLRKSDFKLDASVGDLILLTEFSANGDIIKKEIYPSDPDYKDLGIAFDKEGHIFYTASWSATIGLSMDRVKYGLGATLILSRH